MEKLGRDVEEMLGIALSETQEEMFQRYGAAILEWNQRSNLTAIRDEEGVRNKHFLDSLSCWLAMHQTGESRVIDVGSGAGLPGLALKILQDSIELTLLESVGKKVDFIEYIVQDLGLKGVTVIKGRAEEFGQDVKHRETYDWALARALAPMPILAEYLLPFVKVGGKMIAQKGKKAQAEAEEAKRAVNILGGGGTKIRKVQVPKISEERYLLEVKKLRKTPRKYPRHTGIPKQQPL